jgi:molybdopterin converting factor small subunit
MTKQKRMAEEENLQKYELKYYEFAGYAWVKKIETQDEVCFVKDFKSLQAFLFLICFFQLSIPLVHAKIDVPVPQTIVDNFRRKSGFRYTRHQAEEYIKKAQQPILEELEKELHRLNQEYLAAKYPKPCVQDVINYHMVQTSMIDKVLKEGEKSILENDRNIKSLILTVSSQMDPFGRFKSGHGVNFLSFNTQKQDRFFTLALRIEGLEKRLRNVEELVLFQEQKLNNLNQEQQKLISSIKLGTYVVLLFQIGKVTHFYFSSDWTKEKLKNAKIFFWKKGETFFLLEKEKAK